MIFIVDQRLIDEMLFTQLFFHEEKGENES